MIVANYAARSMNGSELLDLHQALKRNQTKRNFNFKAKQPKRQRALIERCSIRKKAQMK